MSELYELPDGWEWKKLNTVLNVQNGYAFDSKLFSEEIGIQLIRIRDLKNGFKTVSKFTGTYDEKFIVRKNDFLIGMDGDFVCYRWKGENSLLNQRVCRLIDFNSNLNANYIFYGINKFLHDIHKVTAFVTVKHISSKQIKEINFPIPVFQEQKRIVLKLDSLFKKIDKTIALHQKNIDEANVFMGSVLNDVFVELEEKYKKVKLSTVIKIIGGGTPSKKEKAYWNNGTIKWATVGDMNVETIINTELSINENGLKNSSSNLIPKEAIIIATRVGLGKVCYLNDDTAINQDLKGLLPLSDELNIRFLFNFFKNIQKYIISNGTGATVKGVKLDFIKELLIPLPPLKTQQKTVTYLDSISKELETLKQTQKEKMESLVALKASILDQVFRGEL